MGFQQGLSGLNAASKALDAIGNNVSNSNTVGFKSAATQFSDVFAASLAGAAGSQIGIGTAVSNVAQQFTQGNITVTSNPLDLAINGKGFFRMSNAGAITWTRNGQFQVDKDGFIVNAAGEHLTGYLANAAGVISPATPADIQLSAATMSQAPSATTKATVGLNLDSTQSVPTVSPFSPTNALTYNSSTSVTVYDSLGNAHSMGLYFVKTATANQWSLYTNLDGGAAVGPTTLNFSSSGALTTTMPLAQSFAVTTGATSPLAFNLDLTGSTQYGSAFTVNGVTQDGYTSGQLAGLSVSSDGVIHGRYSNGQSRDLAQVVLGNFNNPNGLLSLGGNQWQETAASGQPVLGVAGDGSHGVVQSGAVEESNVDLTAELVNMITQQRAYQANAQTIKTQDQILQTLVNLQ